MDLDAQDAANSLEGVRPGIGAAPDITDGVGATGRQDGEPAIGHSLATNQTEELLSDCHKVSIPLISKCTVNTCLTVEKPDTV